MDASRLLSASMDEEFIYKYFANGHVERTPRRGSPARIIRQPARPEPSASSHKRPVSFTELSRRSRQLDGRLDRLEADKARQDRQPATRVRENIENETWLRDMQKLAGGSYQEKQEVHRKHQDAGLSPDQAKRKCQVDFEDNRWVQQMQTLIGNDYEAKRELWKGTRDE